MGMEPTTALASLQALFNTATTLTNATSTAQRNAQLVEFQKVINQALAKVAELELTNAGLRADKKELEQEIVRMKDWGAQKVGYSTTQIAPSVFAEVKNDHVGGFESAQKLCSNCFSNNTKSILQQSNETTKASGSVYALACPKGCPKLIFTHYLS